MKWERWSYKVVRLRQKWTVEHVVRDTWELFKVGCAVNKMEAKVIKRRCFRRWTEDWKEKWIVRVKNHWRTKVMRRVFVAWEFFVEEMEVEKRCIGVGGWGGLYEFNYRPWMSGMGGSAGSEEGEGGGRREEGLEEIAGGGEEEVVLDLGDVLRYHLVIPKRHEKIVGVAAIDMHRNLRILKATFRRWGRIKARRRTIRRKLGVMSRYGRSVATTVWRSEATTAYYYSTINNKPLLVASMLTAHRRCAIRLKLIDAWSKFPGAQNNTKVTMFLTRRKKRRVFGAWKMLSQTYMKRLEGEDLRDVLRGKREADMEKKIQEAWETGDKEEGGGVKSFLVRVEANAVGRMAAVWKDWRAVVLKEREKKIQWGRRKRAREKDIVEQCFYGWVKETHFIFRRSSWGVGGGGMGGGMGGRNVLSDKSQFMTNYLNNNARQDLHTMKAGRSGQVWR